MVGKNEAGQRLDKLLKKYLKAAPDSFIYKMLRKKNIVLNGKRAEGREMLQLGDSVRLYFSEETMGKMQGSHELSRTKHSLEPSRIIYEDENLLIYNKPAGLLSQADGSGEDALNELCLRYLSESGELSGQQLLTFKPGIANRLDRNTSGLILFGKSLRGLQMLAESLADRSLEKYYLCAVCGRFGEQAGEQGLLRAYLRKDVEKNTVKVSSQPFEGAAEVALSYELLAVLPQYSLLRIHLLSGKTHQIRAQLAQLGHPIVGDPKYGRQQSGSQKNVPLKNEWQYRREQQNEARKSKCRQGGCGEKDKETNTRLERYKQGTLDRCTNRDKDAGEPGRQLLHAYHLRFPESFLGGQSFYAPLPQDFLPYFPDELIKRLYPRL